MTPLTQQDPQFDWSRIETTDLHSDHVCVTS